MWWANVTGWPNGASESATERCFDQAFGLVAADVPGTVSNQLIAQRATPMAFSYGEKDGSYYRSADADSPMWPMWVKVLVVAVAAYLIYRYAIK